MILEENLLKGNGISNRVLETIREYDLQGIHRTGTQVDDENASWLTEKIDGFGLKASGDPFEFNRLNIQEVGLEVEGLNIRGIPLFDCTYTDSVGILGTAGEIGSNADIGVAAVTNSHSVSPDYELNVPKLNVKDLDLQRESETHKAIVVVSDLGFLSDEPALLNAPSFLHPFGPPVVQISIKDWFRIKDSFEAGRTFRIFANCDHIESKARNVSVTIQGTERYLPPLIVMTPRSGWWACTSERGGGVAGWLEIVRAVNRITPKRDVVFTANTGHELGHIGLQQFLKNNPKLTEESAIWIHLGANFASRSPDKAILQYSDHELKGLVNSYLIGTTLQGTKEIPIGQRPGGEVESVYDFHGRYISLVGSNKLFHHPLDRWPLSVEIEKVVQWIQVLVNISLDLSQHETLNSRR